MTNEECEQEVKYCILNMVNSMLTWDVRLLPVFYELYKERFCTHCGRRREYINNTPSPCICDDVDFLNS